SVTSGRSVSIQRSQPARNSRHSSSHAPTSTATPARRSRAAPPPRTCGLGSRTPITTRSTPARTSASAHGPVRPTWLHGSSVTYTVAPRALPSSLASASASACAPPGGWVKPVASTFPARTITAPTGGLGRVRPRARSARRKAWCMNLTSSLLLTRKRVEQRDALLVAAAGERRGEERLERLLGDRAADQPLAEADDVGVVVLARQ